MDQKLRKKLSNWLVIILVLIAGLIYSQVYYSYASSDKVKIYFLDIGQGDSILIDFGDHIQALIDGGPDKSILNELGQYLPIGDRTIEYMVLTHPDSDHLTGLNYVLDEYQVGEVYYTGVNHDSNRYQQFREKIKNLNKEIANYGDVIRPNSKGSLKIIYPLKSYNNQEISELNNSSIVMILDIGEIETLLTGDGEEKVWQQLAEKNILTNLEVLKVSHHGSSNGTTEELLEKIKPEVAIISVGKDNQYGHPKEDVLNLLNQFGVKTYRTDELGTIEMVTDGKEYWVR